MCIPQFCLYVCPWHAQTTDTEPCGRLTLSCQLWSTLCWSGAAAQFYSQGQGSLTAACSGRRIWTPTGMNKQIRLLTIIWEFCFFYSKIKTVWSIFFLSIFIVLFLNLNIAAIMILKLGRNKTIRVLCHTRVVLWDGEWWRGMVFHCDRQNALLPSTVPTSHFLTNWLWGLYDWCTYRKNHFCQASSMTCPWDMTSPSMHRSIKPNLSRTMQIMTNSIILHYALSR